MSTNDLNQRLNERKENRSAYLLAFYQIYDETGKTWIKRSEVAEKSGLAPEIMREVHDYWVGQGYIKDKTMGSAGMTEILPDAIRSVEEAIANSEGGNNKSQMDTPQVKYDVFISHSSKDARIASALIDVLRNSLNIESNKILCTSVPGHRLEIGVRTEDGLRNAIKTSAVFIGLITENSLDAIYVLFELGARWVTGCKLFVMLGPDVDTSILEDPLKQYNAGKCSDRDSVYQLITEIGRELGKTPESPHTYGRYIEVLVEGIKDSKVE